MRTRLVLVVILAALFATAVAAQQPVQPVTYVAEFHVKPEKAEQFLELVKKYDQPIFEKLLAEGAVLAWGVDIPMLHQPGGATHSFWWTSADLAAFDKVFAALEAQEKKILEEDKKAAEAARKAGKKAPKTFLESFLETIDLSKHKDYLLRDAVTGSGSAQPASGSMPYTLISLVTVLPGKGDEYRRLWEEYNKPVYDKLAAEGALYGYALGTEEAKSTDLFTHYVVVSMPNLAAREKVRAAFRADRAARTPAERSMISGSFQAVVDESAGRTIILRSVIFQTAAPK